MFYRPTERLVIIDPLSAEARFVLNQTPAQLRFPHVLRGARGFGPFLLLGQLRERELWEPLLVHEKDIEGPHSLSRRGAPDSGGWTQVRGPKVSESLYPNRYDAVMAAKCRSEWETWLAGMESWERKSARRVRDAFDSWAPSNRPTVQQVVDLMPTMITGLPRRWWGAVSPIGQRAFANDLIVCRYSRPDETIARVVRRLVKIDNHRREKERVIPGERPLTMAEQKARRAKKKPKPRVAAIRRPPQDPAPLQERRFGVCQRCNVCLAYDVNEGCCTVCARPLTRLNPHDNPGMRRFKDPAEATRHADRAARRSDQPHYVYVLSSNPRYAVLSEGHPVQYQIEQGALAMGSARLMHTASPAPASNPRKRRKKKAKSSRGDRKALLRRLLRI